MKKQYRVTLFKSNSTADELALAACYGNGQICDAKITLQNLEGIFKNAQAKYPVANGKLKCSIAGNILTIDETTGEDTICILLIEEIELCDLKRKDELDYSLQNEN